LKTLLTEPPIEWPYPLQTREMIQSICPIWYDFDWRTKFKHNQPRFAGSLDLTQAIAHFAESQKLKPILVLSDHLDVSFDHRHTESSYVAIINVNRFRELASVGNKAGPFFLNVLNGLLETPSQDTKSTSRLRFSQLLSELARLGDSVWLSSALSEVSPHLIRSLIDAVSKCLDDRAARSDISLLTEVFSTNSGQTLADLATIARRRDAVTNFEMRLKEDKWTETDWQNFFSKNIWILGNSSDFVFGNLIKEQAIVRPPAFTGIESRKADYLIRSAGEVSFTRIVELKTPSTQLMEKRPFRRDLYRTHSDLMEGIHQVMSYCRDWERASIDSRNQIDAYSICPRGVVIAGSLNSIKDVPSSIRCFEEFRGVLHNIDIVCFDELLNRAKAMVSDST